MLVYVKSIPNSNLFLCVSSSKPMALPSYLVRSFPTRIRVNLPTYSERLEMIRALLAHEEGEMSSLDVSWLAETSSLHTFSNLASLCKLAFSFGDENGMLRRMVTGARLAHIEHVLRLNMSDNEEALKCLDDWEQE